MNNDMLREALKFAADTIELFDDATMQADYMLDAGECAGIIRALIDSPRIRALATSTAERKRSPYVLGVKPCDWGLHDDKDERAQFQAAPERSGKLADKPADWRLIAEGHAMQACLLQESIDAFLLDFEKLQVFSNGYYVRRDAVKALFEQRVSYVATPTIAPEADSSSAAHLAEKNNGENCVDLGGYSSAAPSSTAPCSSCYGLGTLPDGYGEKECSNCNGVGTLAPSPAGESLSLYGKALTQLLERQSVPRLEEEALEAWAFRALTEALAAPRQPEDGVQKGWKQAIEWLRNNYQDYPNVASLCDAMLAVSGENT